MRDHFRLAGDTKSYDLQVLSLLDIVSSFHNLSANRRVIIERSIVLASANHHLTYHFTSTITYAFTLVFTYLFT
jgi:hypothetical protein